MELSDGDETEYIFETYRKLVTETDANGNTIAYSYGKDGEGVNESYSYDNSGRLTGYTNDSVREGYTYDAEGARRSKKTGNTTTYFINDYTGSISLTLAETDESGSLTASYIRADELIGQVRGGQISYYLFDGHGDVRALVNEEGSLIDTYSYTAYGELTARTGDTENHYLYTGEYYDGASGLYYLRARYMNPGTGSFISMDSYTGSIYDPASLHRYTYVKDNPVMYKDPSGYKPDSLTGTSIALGIREVLSHVVELNCIGILNSIINATAATLMGGTEDEVLKVLFSGYILGAGMAGLAYFVGAVYALTYAQVMLAEMAAGEAASFAMMVVSAFDGDSSSVVQYEIMNMLYFMSATLMYNGSLPKNDMKPSKNGWNCDVWNAGSQGGLNPDLLEELSRSGVKYNPDDIVAIIRTADGKIVWLENGTESAGLNHIIAEHADDFLNRGITQEQIADYIMSALENGKIVGYQGRGMGRPIYEFIYNGVTNKVAITIGNNGFIVGANPK